MSANPDQPFVPNWRTKMTMPLAVILGFVLLMLCLPRKTGTAYSFEENRPWHYDQLIAPFDFPILLSETQMMERRDSAMAQFMPYFTKTDSVDIRNVRHFLHDFDKGAFAGVPTTYRRHLAEMLANVYSAGIVSNAAYQKLLDDKSVGIRLVEGNKASTRNITTIYTSRSAYDFIMTNDNEHYSRDVLQHIDLTQYLVPNLALDTTKTNEAIKEMNEGLTHSAGMIQVGERIIDRGEIITPKRFSIITSYIKEVERRRQETSDSWTPLLGKGLVIFIFFLSSIVYLYSYRADYTASINRVILYLGLIVVFPLLTYLMIEHSLLNIYMLPYPMVAIFARIFFDSRTALQVVITSTLLSAIAVSDPYGFILLQLAVCTSAVYAVKDITERAQLFKVAVIVLAMGLCFCVIYDIYQGIDLTRFFASIDRSRYFSVAVSGVLLLLSYPLLYVVERFFNITSSVTLVELSNINNAILRRMTKVAQGTFNHSIQVGNLAAEVADALGADVQLVRTAAFYHDIGKTLNPAYFTENQRDTNPHDQLTEEESARIIINHVTEGLRLAEKYHLPKIIADFIPTHHGRSRTGYFYIQWKNKHGGEEPPEEMFTYPGPNPWTKEQAILMMCDSIEASSRSLTDYSEESLRTLVNKIIDKQLSEGYFNESPLTFRDITTAKQVLVESLKVIYHTRIAYPEERKSISRWFGGHRHRR